MPDFILALTDDPGDDVHRTIRFTSGNREMTNLRTLIS